VDRSPALTKPPLKTRATAAHPRQRVAGFTIVEMMVTLSIIALMIALLVPLLGRTREAAHRLMCAANLRQIGVGLSLYGSTHSDRLPSTVFARGDDPQPQEMITLTTGTRSDPDEHADWDGLGWLIGDGRMFVDSPRVLFCPSHRGTHRPEFAAKDLASHNVFTRIYINYHYIGDLDRTLDRVRRLDTDPNQAIVADGMRELSDVNHVDGSNVLRSDVSVSYWADRHSLMARSVKAVSLEAADPGPVYRTIWNELSRLKP
jgi:prepilin-type N-terminal cleavage/methylation domain-containing protein